jgi:hypothetical protein
MGTADLSEAALNAYNCSDSGVDHVADSWVRPIASAQPTPADHSFFPAQAFGLPLGDEYSFRRAKQNDLHHILTSLASQRKLIICTVVVTALGVAALAYVFWPSAGEKVTQAEESTPVVQSTPVAPVSAASQISQPSRTGLPTIAWPDLPPSGTLEASPQIGAATPAGNIATRQTIPVPQDRGIAFVQRPSVNIRSTPSTTGSILGTAPKGALFKVAKREGDWVQVESDRVKGWINSQFLGPNKP